MIQAGKLRHMLEVQAPSKLRDAEGGETENYRTVTFVYGSLEPLAGRELEIARATHARVTHRVKTRYREELTAAKRLRHEGRSFGVLSVRNVEERDRDHVLLVEESA